MADVISINGTPINLALTTTSIDRCIPYVKGGIPELQFSRLLGPLTTLPDPWSGQPCTLTMGGTLVFAGDVQGYVDRWMDGFGWLREYRALGLLNRAGYIPVTDSETLTDTSYWNLPGDDPLFLGSRAGLTIGAVVGKVLVMAQNAAALSAAGIGNYTTLGPPAVLPAVTLADLATLTVVPPWRSTICGERILATLEAYVTAAHPNHFLHVDPLGYIRFLDSRTFTGATITIGADPRVGMPMLTRDFSECYSRVQVRGNSLVRGWTLQTQPWPGSSAADGGLAEFFDHDGLSNAAAKAAWVPANWSQPNQYGAPFDTGTCTEPDTTHVVVTSANTAMTWATNQLAQGVGQQLCQIVLVSDTLAGTVTQQFQARVVANTALTAGGTSTLTLDIALPATTYGSYQLFGLARGANVVGRRYKVTNLAVANKMLNFFPYPFAYTNSQGSAASLTSTPVGTVMWSAFGTSPPYNTGYDGITLDPDNGLVYFDKPTQVVAGGLSTPTIWPANVQAFVPIAAGTLAAWAPSSSTDAGTLHSVEGISRTKVISILEWKDYSNQVNMNTFASEVLDSVKDVVVEGTLPYLGLLTTYLAPGRAVSIAGSGFITGWESLALPVVSASIEFQPGPAGTSYVMNLSLSNRRGRFSSENFLRPNITGAAFGGGATETFSGGAPTHYASGTAAGQQGERAQAERGRQQQEAHELKMREDPTYRGQVQAAQARQQAIDANPWAQAQQQFAAMGGGGGAPGMAEAGRAMGGSVIDARAQSANELAESRRQAGGSVADARRRSAAELRSARRDMGDE